MNATGKTDRQGVLGACSWIPTPEPRPLCDMKLSPLVGAIPVLALVAYRETVGAALSTNVTDQSRIGKASSRRATPIYCTAA